MKHVATRWRYYTDYDLEDRWFYSESPEWKEDHPELEGVIEIQQLYIMEENETNSTDEK